MPVGRRIYQKVDRPDPSLVERFAIIPVTNISDVLGGMACVDSGIRPLNNVNLAGTAITVKAPFGEGTFLFHMALDIAQPGDVIVVDAGGCTERSVGGEGMMLYARNKGIRGFVVDGALRDSGATSELSDFAVYTKAIQGNAQKAANTGEINVPVSIGGVVVFPGDIIRGDEDGIVVIHSYDAANVIDEVETFAEKDREKNQQSGDGTLDHSWVRKVFEEKGFEFLDKAWDEE